MKDCKANQFVSPQAREPDLAFLPFGSKRKSASEVH